MGWSQKLSCLSFFALVLAAASGACTIESDDDNDDAGSAGVSGTSGASGSGTSGSAGRGGSAASGASGASGSGGAVSSECGLLAGPAEAEPNGDTAQATAYALGESTRGCVGLNNDVDTFSFTTPADGTGGGVLVSFTEVGKGSETPLGALSVRFRAEGDNGDVFTTYTATAGGNLSAYFAAAPGRKYYVQVEPFSGEKFVYTMKATYTAVADAFEPNDTKATATPIELNTGYSAYYFAGYTGAAAPTEEQLADYYSVDLAAGPATVKLRNMPGTLTGYIHVFNPAGVETSTEYVTTAGADVTDTFTVEAADIVEDNTFLIRVDRFSGVDFAGQADALPAHFTNPYELTVTQP